MKIIYTLFTCLLIPFSMISQEMGGLEVSSYSGITGVNLQPANLASSPYSLDVNIIGASATAGVRQLLPETTIGNTFYSSDQFTVATMLESQQQNIFVNANILMPSALFRINEKSGLAFTWKIRVVAYATVTNASLSLLARNDFEVSTFGDIPVIESMVGLANTWEEFGLSYGRNIYDEGRHKIDLGVSAKYLVGGASGYVEVNGLNVDYDRINNSVDGISGNIAFTYNSELDELSEGTSKKLFSSSGYGMNAGLNYEYKSAKHLKKNIKQQNQPNYLFKVSTSFRDMGKINFNASENSYSLSIQQEQPIDATYFDNIKSVGGLAKKLINTFDVDIKKLSDYSLRLPTTWNLNIDYNVWKNFYANAYVDFTGVQMRESFFKSQMLKQYSFSGRFEKSKYGVYTSVSYNKYSKWGSSFSFRYSVIYLGVSNLITLNKSNSVNTLGLVLALKIPILSKSNPKKNRIL